MENGSRFKVHYGWTVLAMGTLTVFAALGLARFGYSMLLPNMQADLEMGNGQAGLLATLSLSGYLALAIIGGALAARFGVRLVTTLGLLLAGVTMILTGIADSYLWVAIWSALTGVGSGAVNIAIMGLWPAWFSKQRRGLASGIAVSGSSIGLIVTGFTVPRIVHAYGMNAWHVSWVIFGVITLLIAAGAYMIIRNNPAGLGLKPIGDGGTVSVHRGTPNWKQVYFSGAVWRLGLVYIAFGFSYIVFMTFFVKHLVADAGFTQQAAASLFMLLGTVSLLSGLVWGTVSDYIGRKNTLTIIYLMHTLAFGLFAIGDSNVYFTLSAILYGLSAWSIPAIMSAACGDMLGPELAPAALGFITLFFGIGQVLGPAAAGFLADATGTFSWVFGLVSGVALLGAVGSALLLRGAAQRQSG